MLKKIGLILIIVVGLSLVLGGWQYQVQVDKLNQVQKSSDLGNYFQAIRVSEAVEDSLFIQAIGKLPENWRPRLYWQMHFNKGVALFGLETKIVSEPTKGEVTAEEAFLQAKNCPELKADALYYLGLISLVQNDAEQAIYCWTEALKVNENHYQAKYNLEWVQKPREGQPQEGEGKGQKTKELLKKATEQLDGDGEGGGDQQIKK